MLSVLCIPLLIAGCDNKEKPENLIDEETYIELIAELQVAESALEVSSDSLNAKQLIQRVMDRHEVTYRQFIDSHKYYSKDFQAQQKRIQKALDILQQKRANLTRSDTTKSRNIMNRQ